jgi:Gram-negative porin
MILGPAAAYATDAWAGEVTAAAAVSAEASPPSPTCVSLEDFVITNCPLTWNGVTVYGTIDAGVTWRSHGAPFNGTSAIAEDYLIQKYSNHALWGLGPNALSQSNIGIKGNEPLASGWAFVFDLEAGFDPYSLQFANGPHSVAQNAGVPLTSQTRTPTRAEPGNFTIPWAI